MYRETLFFGSSTGQKYDFAQVCIVCKNHGDMNRVVQQFSNTRCDNYKQRKIDVFVEKKAKTLKLRKKVQVV